MNQFEKKVVLSGAIKALDYIQGLETRGVAPSVQGIKNLDAFDEDLSPNGIDALETIEFLDQYGSPGTVASNGSRYYGFVIGGSHPAALAANFAEVRRVLRPDGRFWCVEHVAAPEGSRIASVQRLVKRPWRWFFEGCDTHRDVAGLLRDAGFAAVEITPFTVRTAFLPVRSQIAAVAVR